MNAYSSYHDCEPDFSPPLSLVDRGRLWCALARADATEPLAQIATALVARLEDIRLQPGHILDLGDRSGVVAALSHSRWPQASLTRVGLDPVTPRRFPPHPNPGEAPHPALTADLAHLPLADASFDLVISNMALHWCAEPGPVFREVRRVLRPEGMFLFTTCGDETLKELRRALATLDQQRHGRMWPRVLATPDMRRVGDDLIASGLAIPVMDRDYHRLAFPSVSDLLRRLKHLGAGNHHHVRHPGLTGKGFVHELEAIYRSLYPQPDGSIQATLEVYFGHACRMDHHKRRSRTCGVKF
ncbi:MAG: methyltransferase domain-containing protein [Magnetococcales bacterium]|nr:methyltransferase domain-containing protein [Magnetococcales bacterium]